MDTYSFTTASARADWLENRKAEIEQSISDVKNYRDLFPEWSEMYQKLDKEVDSLIAKKDNLRPLEVEAWQNEAEALALEAADEKATQASAQGTLY